MPPPDFPHDVGGAYFRRYDHRHATPHGFEHGVAKILRIGSEHEDPRCSEQTLLIGSDNGTRQDANPVRNSQVSSKLHKSRSEALIVRAHNGEFACPGARECAQKPIQSLFPAEPPEKQNERLLRGNRLDVCGYLAIAGRWLVNSIWNDGQPRVIASRSAGVPRLRAAMSNGQQQLARGSISR